MIRSELFFYSKRIHSRGQATIEFLVAAIFVLVPLFLAIAAVGKFADVRYAAEMAARYATWERTVWFEKSADPFQKKNGPNSKTSTEITNEARARLLNDRSSSGSVIKPSDKNMAGLINGIDPMWHDPAGTPYLNDYTQLSNSTSMGSVKGETAFAIANAGYLEEKLHISPQTLASTSLQLTAVAKDSGTYQRLWAATSWAGLDFSAQGAILSNTWAANGTGGTLEMVTDLVATRNPKNKSVQPGLIGVRNGMRAWDSVVNNMEIGKVAVDEVPPDRLK